MTTPISGPRTLDQRVENQLDRIEQGVENGSLTPGQAAKLSQRDFQIERQISQAKAANGGRLSPQQHAKFEQELNKSSGRIYDEKHDVRPRSLEQRADNQNRRIDQGLQNGTLSPRQAERLQKREGGIQREIARDRAQNGGTLTPSERANIERQFNALSNRIYDEKHSATPDVFKP